MNEHLKTFEEQWPEFEILEKGVDENGDVILEFNNIPDVLYSELTAIAKKHNTTIDIVLGQILKNYVEERMAEEDAKKTVDEAKNKIIGDAKPKIII